MAGFGFNIVPKELFFDSKRVIEALVKGTRDALSRAGAFVMTRARSSIRSSKNSAKPGRPPRSHTGDLKNKIYFAYDDTAGKNAVVIGPLRYRKGEAPNILEFGGDEHRMVRDIIATRDANGRFAGNKFGPRHPGVAHYPGNPFMGPSLKTEVDKGTIAKAWEGCVKA
jgi:hypothetical protein